MEPPKPAPTPKPTVQPSPLEDIALETATAHYAARTASCDKVAQALISQGAGEGPLLFKWQAYHAWYVRKTSRQYQQHVLALIADGGWKDAQIPNDNPEDNW